MQNTFWTELDIVKLLAIAVISAWLVAMFMHLEIDSTLTNVVMIIVGFFYGSSTGSKAKDAALAKETTSIPSPDTPKV